MSEFPVGNIRDDAAAVTPAYYFSHGRLSSDFGERKIPNDAIVEAALAEATVGLLDGERATGNLYDVEAFNEAPAGSLGAGGLRTTGR